MMQRMTAKIISCLIIICSAASANGQYTMNLNILPSNSVEGDHVNIECNVTNLQRAPFTVVLFKRIPGGTTEVDIADKNGVKSPFNSFGRYSINHKEVVSNFNIRFTLTINNLKSSDSGEIGCKIPNHNVEIFRHFTVFVPVKSVRLSSSDRDGTHAVHNIKMTNEKGSGSMQTAEFKEGEVRQVSCHVTGSYPKPEVRMLIGNRDITTELFNETVTVVKEGLDTSPTTYYKVELWNRALPIDYSFNGRPLQCVANMPKSEFHNETASIHVTLLGFRPKFLCSGSKMADLYQANVNLSCAVHANPPVTTARFHWKRHSAGNVSLEAGHNDGHYTGSLRGGNAVNKEMVLNIDQIFIQHYRTYYFVAVNKHGETEFAITLQQDHAHALKGGANDVHRLLRLGVLGLALLFSCVINQM